VRTKGDRATVCCVLQDKSVNERRGIIPKRVLTDLGIEAIVARSQWLEQRRGLSHSQRVAVMMLGREDKAGNSGSAFSSYEEGQRELRLFRSKVVEGLNPLRRVELGAIEICEARVSSACSGE
jgi:hypothetical protein